ncbi:PREDICTED: disintegrin and metalloproteinase domain-containing protein 2-like [Chaetura pelagica]|uniref:disintegrin and metalloproteinase domain-containing protein 2-like n=1 Tax=Chaetura pelagica TaxID=8897 RepID=UPI000523D766|nr:PREDICTED: disintegrin and metalloproteinase domain-containing protein 2-like [Chaetura pelagica]
MVLQVTVPQKLLSKGAGETDTVSYGLRIEGKPYTIHLQQHVFLSDDFRIYVANEKEPLRSNSARVRAPCHYQGYIEGFPSSAVTLSTCSGLRGLLQFENVSYGIEPRASSPAFEHFVYRVSEKQVAGSLLANGPTARGLGDLVPEEHLSYEAQSPKYFEVYVVLDKALFNYMGSDTNAVTQKIFQVFNLVNSMFNPLNVTVVLTSLELWTKENKISTEGAADDLLQRFLEWKQSRLTLQSYDIAHLLVPFKPKNALCRPAADLHCDLPEFCNGSSASCPPDLYVQDGHNCEHSSGYCYQGRCRSPDLQCRQLYGKGPGRVCVMSPEALHFSGAKAFSNCSVGDFETFLSRPSVRAACGNGVVEPGEQCDCGTPQECLKDKCCNNTCQFKLGVKCSSGLCCNECQFKPKNALCRPAADLHCDLPEFCNGSSASCPPDLYVQDGHNCEHSSGYCYQGRCRSPDLQCRQIYGKDSKSAPVACYEELNSHGDRFGHCGFQPRQGFKSCAWRHLRCGKLICTYPYSTPFPSDVAAALYVRVHKDVCVSLNYLNTPARLDPLLVPPGTKCGSEKVCINNTCQPLSVLGSDCDSEEQCHGHGVCNNKGHCHCHPGWKPPDCLRKGSPLGGSIDSGLQLSDSGLPRHQLLWDRSLGWQVLGSCLLVLILAFATSLILWWQGCSATQEDGDCSEPDLESDPESELESDAEPDLESDPEPDLESDAEPDSDLGSEPGPPRGR